MHCALIRTFADYLHFRVLDTAHGMKRFLTISLAFLLPLCCLLALGEWMVRSYPTSYGLKAYLARTQHAQARTLVFGNSRAYYGILTDSLDHALNLANVSQTLEYDCFYLLHYFSSDAGELRNVIVQLDYSNVFDPPLEQSSWDDYRCTYYRLYAGCEKHGLMSRYGMELFNPERFKMKFSHALNRLTTGESQLDCDSTGFGITTTRRFDASRMAHATADGLARYRAIDMEMLPYNARFLHQMGAFCQQNHVRMILVAMPIWRELYEQKGHDEEPALAQLVQDCRQRYGAEFRDYTADPRMHDEDFVDAVHLSPEGARHFTQLLQSDFGI